MPVGVGILQIVLASFTLCKACSRYPFICRGVRLFLPCGGCCFFFAHESSLVLLILCLCPEY